MKDILIVEVEDYTVSPLYPTYGSYDGDILMFNGYNTGTNSGFDLYQPNDIIVPSGAKSFMIDLGVRCQLKRGGIGGSGSESGAGSMHGYYLYPRSSLSKTPLRLCNSVGIIDYEYRGTIRVVVDNVSSPAEPYTIRKGERLFQLCMPSLCPFTVEYGKVNRDTGRGEGGFGSTGK